MTYTQVLLTKKQKERLNELKEMEFHLNHKERPFDRVCFIVAGWSEVERFVIASKEQNKARQAIEQLGYTVMYQAFTIASHTHLIIWQSNEWQLIQNRSKKKMAKYFVDYKNVPNGVWKGLNVFEAETKEEAIKQAVIGYIQSNVDIELAKLKAYCEYTGNTWSVSESFDCFQAIINEASQAEFRIYEEIKNVKERNVLSDLQMAQKLSHER